MKKPFKEFLATPFLVIVVCVMTVAANFIPENTLGIDSNPYLAVIILEFITSFLPSLLYCRVRGRELRPRMHLNGFGKLHIMYLIYTSLFLICGSTLISMLMYSAFPEAFSSASIREYAAFAMNSTVFDGVYLVLTFAIMPAAAEEFLYRGIVIGEYSRKGALLASIMCSVMFAISHFSPARFPVYFFAGIVMSMVVFCTGSLLAAVVVHTLYNTVVLLSENFVIHVVDRQNVSLVLLLLVLVQIFLISGGLMCMEARRIYAVNSGNAEREAFAQPDDGRSQAARYVEAFLSPAFIILVIIFIVVPFFMS